MYIRGDVFEALSGMEVDPADCRPASTLAEAAGLTWDTKWPDAHARPLPL
ncbi:hypothetical protein AB0F72_10890 [Actinoplanes sp. NPDC023936]